jgi:hypothetical protein
MSNMMVNRISATLSDEQLKKVKESFKTIFDTLPLVGLTKDERVTLPKISETNKIFVEDCLVALKNNGEFLPAYLRMEELEKDITLFNQLDEIASLSAQLTEKLSDTQMLAGSEAYITALTAYRLFEAASNAGLAGSDAVYDQLKQRFAGQGSTAAKSTAPAALADAPVAGA